jgi:ABC-type multidrug transport system ATPase subunit
MLTPGSTPLIEAAGLSKFYGEFAAIRQVSFSVPQGQVAAFLGPNGAGKSTTLKILSGYLAPSEGAARAARYGGDAASGERRARELNNRFADWFYVIRGADFEKLRLKRRDVVGSR